MVVKILISTWTHITTSIFTQMSCGSCHRVRSAPCPGGFPLHQPPGISAFDRPRHRQRGGAAGRAGTGAAMEPGDQEPWGVVQFRAAGGAVESGCEGPGSGCFVCFVEISWHVFFSVPKKRMAQFPSQTSPQIFGLQRIQIHNPTEGHVTRLLRPYPGRQIGWPRCPCEEAL